MNKTSILCIVMVTLFALTGCEIIRTEESAQGEISAFTPPEGLQPGVNPAQPNAVVRLQPNPQQLVVNQVATVDIMVENVVDLVNADIQISFASSVLQVQDARADVEGVQISPGDLLPESSVSINAVDNTIGAITYRVSQTAPVSPANNGGLLASFNVQATGAGNGILTFSTVRLTNSTEQDIPVTPQESQITVIEAQPPTDTPVPTAVIAATVVITVGTPTPTVTPTPTTSPMAELPPGATVGQCYRVQHRDTLVSIAREFGTSPQNIQIVNDLFPAGHIYVQKALFVPSEMMGSGPNFYLAKEGDTYEIIARTCNLPADFLEWVNEPRLEGIGNLSGQYIEIPIPPFPPPARYPYPRSGPFGPPSVYPPPSIGPPVPIGGPPCGSGCSGW